ncbi:Putative bacteriophage holin protein [Haemophilus influenzae]|uniref:Bacteriophage holin protein n=1 Tax=Haemophilus influenzae TaxID=727 RepID=A0A2X1PUI9_HAEIF|nr:Putative bacteriophage holin protein [Haemophilus influenzae]
MPIKEPDVWALIWSWLQTNLSSSSAQSAFWALFYFSFKIWVYA